jgi:hypothetical protein
MIQHMSSAAERRNKNSCKETPSHSISIIETDNCLTWEHTFGSSKALFKSAAITRASASLGAAQTDACTN